MYRLLLALFLLFPLVAPASADAPAPPIESELLPGNYEIRLKIHAREKARETDLTFITASKEFEMDLIDPSIRFSGRVELLDNGKILVRYDLSMAKRVPSSTGDPDIQSSGWQSSVLLQPGKAQEILRMRGVSFLLSVNEAAKPGEED